MLFPIISLSLSVHYAVPVQPMVYYSYGFDVQVSHRYMGASLFRVSGSGEYSFTAVTGGVRYRYRIFSLGLEGGLHVRSRNDAREMAIGSSVYVGLQFGSRWRVHLGWKLFPGMEKSLSFLLLGVGYSW